MAELVMVDAVGSEVGSAALAAMRADVAVAARAELLAVKAGRAAAVARSVDCWVAAAAVVSRG